MIIVRIDGTPLKAYHVFDKYDYSGSTHGDFVTGVRFGNDSSVITRAEWGVVDVHHPSTWLTAPRITTVNFVINAIRRGRHVQSQFLIDGHVLLGPELQIRVLPKGKETLEMAEYQEGRTLHDLHSI